MARKMSPLAKAEEGQLRVCVECDEEKVVNLTNFSLYNKGVRGWHTVCRVCQGVDAIEGSGKALVKRTPNPHADDDLHDLINEMYLLAETKKKAKRLEQISAEIKERVISQGLTKHGFMTFVEIVKPLVAGWKTPGAIHEDIIDGLLSDHRRRLVIATRYSAKSTLTGIYVTWRILHDPLIKVMIISRGSKLATRMLRVIRKVFIQYCPILEHLMPNEDCLDNAEQFQTPMAASIATGGATLSSFGITSDLPGYRADLTIGDDVEGPSDDTPEKVVELEEKLNELHMINPTGEKVMLGTYQTEFSVYAKLADKEDVDGEPVWELHRACMFEEDNENKTIRSRWPDMFSDKDALDWRRSVTARAWRLHALLIADPSILNEKPLKISDFIVIDHPPKVKWSSTSFNRGSQVATELPTWGAPKGDVWYRGTAAGDTENYVATIAAVDPASGLAGRDAIGVAIVGVTLGGQAVVRHLEGVRGQSKAANMRRCALIMREFGADVLIIEETEAGFFGETLENELVLVDYPLSVEKVTTGGQQKGRRIIEALAPPMGDGRLVILDSVVRSDHGGEFVNQLTRISYDGRTGKSRDHDDIVDALAHAVAKVKGDLTSDRADLNAAHQQSKIDRWRDIPLRFGGLGGYSEEHDTHGEVLGRGVPHDGIGYMSLGELLVEEDEVLASLEARKDRLMEAMREDQQLGRVPDQRAVNRVKALTAQIKELKEAKVI